MTPAQRYRRRWPERCAASLAKHRKTARFKRKAADSFRLRTYGMQAEEYDRLILESGGYCPLCQRQSTPGGDGTTVGDNELVVDHDHVSGRWRGLICQACNKTLGFLERHALGGEWFSRALEYTRSAA